MKNSIITAAVLVAAAGTAHAQTLGDTVRPGVELDIPGLFRSQNTTVTADSSDAVEFTDGTTSITIDPFDTGFVVTNTGPAITISRDDNFQLQNIDLNTFDGLIGLSFSNSNDWTPSATTSVADDIAFVVFTAESVFPAGASMTVTFVTSPPAQISSLNDGEYFAPATWDLRVPTSADGVSLSHDVTLSDRTDAPFGFNTSVSDLRIGENADASLVNNSFERLIVGDALQIGLNGFTGSLTAGPRDVRAGNITVGESGPGVIISAENQDIDALGNTFPGFFAFRVGTNGFPGTITKGRGDIFSAGGIAFGPDATFNFIGSFGNPRFADPILRTGNNTPIQFDNSAVIDLTNATFDDVPAVNETFPFASAFGSTVTGSPKVLNPIGYTLIPDTSNPSQLNFTVQFVPSTFNWTNPASGNWAIDGNWDTSSNPGDTGGFVFVQSGGTATAEGTGPLGFTSIALNTLDIGGFAGDGAVNIVDVPNITITGELNVGSNRSDDAAETGTPAFEGSLSIANADTVRFGDNVNVGSGWATGTANLTTTGALSIDNVNTLIIEGGIDAGAPRAEDFQSFLGQTVPANGTVATGHGFVTLTNIGTVSTGGTLDLADGTAFVSNDPGPVTVNQSVTFLAQNINAFNVGGDLDLGVSVGSTGETENASGVVTFDNVGLLFIDGDLDTIQGGGSAGETGIVNHDMTLNVIDVDLMEIDADIDMNHNPNIRGSSLLDLRSTWNITRSNVLVNEGGEATMGNIDLGGAAPTPDLTGATGNTIFTQVTLLESTFTSVDETRFGVASEDAPTTGFSTGIVLDDGSYGSAGYLRQGVAGEFIFHVDGLQRKSLGDGNPNTYSVWDVPFNPALAAPGAPAVELNGAVTIDFDFTPPSGTHVFDFIISTGQIASTATLSINDLPAGFSVTSFGVMTTTTGVSSLRLVIADCAGDLNGDGAADFLDVAAGLNLIASGVNEGDLNGDGMIDGNDVDQLLINVQAGCP